MKYAVSTDPLPDPSKSPTHRLQVRDRTRSKSAVYRQADCKECNSIVIEQERTYYKSSGGAQAMTS
jgi:hypothetical protein